MKRDRKSPATNIFRPHAFSTSRIVIKFFQGGMHGDLMTDLKESLKNIKNFKPKASRKESPEMYLIAQKK